MTEHDSPADRTAQAETVVRGRAPWTSAHFAPSGFAQLAGDGPPRTNPYNTPTRSAGHLTGAQPARHGTHFSFGCRVAVAQPSLVFSQRHLLDESYETP